MAIEDNIPTQGPNTSFSKVANLVKHLGNKPTDPSEPTSGRNESSTVSPMGTAGFATQMKSDIAPMAINFSQTRLTSLFSSDPQPTTGRHELSDTAPQNSVLGSNNENSIIAPITLGAPDLKSLFQIKIEGLLEGRHESSNTAPQNSILGTNNQASNTAPQNSILGTNNQASNTAPITSTLTGRFDASSIVPFISQISGRHESSGIDSSITQLSGRHESSAVDSSITQLSGRHESSAVDSSATTLDGRHESSGVDSSATTLDGRHETSNIDSSPTTPDGRFESSDIDSSATTLDGRHESSDIDSSLTTPDGRFESSDIDSSPTTPDGRFESSDIDSSLTTPDGRHETSAVSDSWDQDIIFPLQQADLSPYAQPGTANWMDDTFASGFILNKEPQQTDYTPAGLEYSPYPGAPAPSLFDGRHGSSIIDDALTTQDGRHYPGPPPPQPTIDITTGVDFFGFNTDASGFTIQNSLLDSQYQGISGPSYTYPDSQGLGFGTLGTPIALAGRNESSNFSKEPGVNFLDIPNLDAQGFTVNFDTGDASQFKGITGQTYTHPDNHGLGIGTIGNSLFTNIYPTPYTTPLFPDGFTENQAIEDSQFSKDSFAGGGKIGLDTEFTHATFGGVQAQVPIMGNNPTGLGEFTSGGATSGDIGTISAFDELAGGTEGFTIHDPSVGSERYTDGALGGAIIGSSLNAEYKHRTPVPGVTYGNLTPANTGGTGAAATLTEDTTAGVGSGEAGKTFGAIGVINAFDDKASGAKGFTAKMFDLGLPKTQFNGVAGTPGSLTYDYPVDVGPAGEGRLMYNMPFSDAGNPFGGAYTSHISAQIPVNPTITINKGARTDLSTYSLYNSSPSGLTGIVDTDPARPFFNEVTNYSDIIGNFTTDITINDKHPGSFLGDFSSREGSPTPLDAMQVLIPANTGPTGESDDTATYTHVDGYPNYNTHNLSYGDAEIANQRTGFERNELIARHEDYDYNKSDLYGHDIKFGGYGDDPDGHKSYKKPHIIRDIDSNWGLGGMAFDEGAFRGGFLTLTNRALQDVVRNVKHIISDPIKGLLWGLKQVGLQLSNPKVETEMLFLGRRTRVFNLGVGLIANMLTGPFGIKLYRHGILNGIGEGDATYEKAVKSHGGINPYNDTQAEFGGFTVGKGGGNRLSLLKDELLYFGGEDTTKTSLVAAGLPYSFKGQTIDLLSGLAGPKSLYGIGQTRIRRWEKSDQHMTGDDLAQNIPDTVGGGRSSLLAKYASANHFTLYAEADKMEAGSTSHNDFREATDLQSGNDNFFIGDYFTTPYAEFNREVKFGYSSYTPGRDTLDYVESPAGGADKWNADQESWDADYGSGDVDEDEDGMRDMIKCIVEDVHTKKKVRFRSYVTSIVDTITPSWQATNYIGRPDGVHSYQNTARALTFTLTFAAQSRADMKGMYKRINYLMGLCYPHIGSGSPEDAVAEAMLAPLVKLTIGDWLKKTPGFFSEMSIAIDNKYPWEINLEKDSELAQLPHMVNIQIGFTIIGDGPHVSAVQEPTTLIAGRHIGGGMNDTDSKGTFFEHLPLS